MISSKKYLFLICLFFCAISGNAQKGILTDFKKFKPPLTRQLFHDYIDNEQKAALKADGNADAVLNVSSNSEVNYYVTRALTYGVDLLQYKIDTDSTLTSQNKVKYLRGLENILRSLNTHSFKLQQLHATNLPAVLDAYELCMVRDRAGESIESIIAGLTYEVGLLLVKNSALENNSGIKTSEHILLKKYCHKYPDKIFITLRDNTDVPFLDSLVKVASYRNPRQLYDYAASNNRLGAAIRKMNDPLIKTVSRMANAAGSGQLYFPFLDNIIKGTLKFEEIDAVKDDSIQYYKLLVKTRINYTERILNKEKLYEVNALNTMLERKATDVFVNTINGLHDQDGPIRFRIIQSLSAQELYYLIVLTDGIIYTTSYTSGVYPLLMSKIGQRGDSLLLSLRFDKYRKFIKIAVGYNTLKNFLASFPQKEDAQSLMTAFVSGLEKSEGLEDGVDVADSYTSIADSDSVLANYVLGLTKMNFDRSQRMNNKKGMVMYDLLYKLFLSADSTNNIDLSKEFGIAPVYGVDFKALSNDSNQVVMQVFFYGDKDGQNIFQGFLRQFNNSNWKITPSAQWVSIASTKGKPVLIFANRALPEETGEDEQAQKALNAYLEKNNLKPTVVIHRGHSYYAPYTISQILPSAKIVFMGSCGGYHLIHDILKNAPGAHIIASKQIGKTAINQPFFNLLMEKLRNGNNVEWNSFWKELNKVVRVEGLEDYIPPHKNLGAIFIKAYKKAMGDTEE